MIRPAIGVRQIVQACLSGKFRHVVFASEVNVGVTLDFAPTKPAADDADATPLGPQAAAFVRRLFQQASLCAAHYRPETLHRRLPACLRALRVRSIEQADAAIRHNPRLVPVALESLL